MPSFLFCSLDSPGHLYPMIGIALELANQGHDVAFVTDLYWEQFLARYGLKRISRGDADGSSFQLRRWFNPYSVAIQVKHIEYALKNFNADFLVGQSLTLGPLIAAERNLLPTALLGFFTYLYPTFEPSFERKKLSEDKARLAWRRGDMLEKINQARVLHRLRPYDREVSDNVLLGNLFLLRTVRELEACIDALPESVHLVGSCLWEPESSDPELEDWLSETENLGLSLIYIQHGRSFDLPGFWSQIVEAFGGSGEFRVAASVGRMDGEVGDLPSNFYVRDHLPQCRVLRSARAMIASANTTAVLGAITAGIPSLLIPGGGEQPDVARVCQRAELARIISPQEAAPKTLLREIGILLSDDHYKKRAVEYSTILSSVNGHKKASNLLASLARTYTPVPQGLAATAST